MAKNQTEAIEEISLIRQTLIGSQNSNFRKMKWLIFAMGVLFLVERYIPYHKFVSYWIVTRFLDSYSINIIVSFFGFEIALDRLVEVSMALFLVFAYGLLSVICLVKRRKLQANTVIRSEMLLYDVWCGCLIWIPTMLKVVYAIVDLTPMFPYSYYMGEWYPTSLLKTSITYGIRVSADIVLFCSALILTGIVLKKRWVGVLSGVYMTIPIMLMQYHARFCRGNPCGSGGTLYYIAVYDGLPTTVYLNHETVKYVVLFLVVILLLILDLVDYIKARKAQKAVPEQSADNTPPV